MPVPMSWSLATRCSQGASTQRRSRRFAMMGIVRHRQGPVPRRPARGLPLRRLVVAGVAWWTMQVSAQGPLPSDTKSLEMIDDGVIVFTAPNEAAGRRGTIMRGTRTPALGRVLGTGCGNGVFLQVGVDAFICEHDARPSILS